MSVPLHRQIKPGTLVSIVLKQDQRTGKQVQGTVKDVLTRHDHPRGIKVRLNDGRIGRVQKLVNSLNSPQPPINTNPQYVNKKYYTTMADNNPWHNAQSQGNPFQNNSNDNYGPPPGPPPGHQQQQQPNYGGGGGGGGGGTAQGYYNGPSAPAPNAQSNPWATQSSQSQQPTIPPRNPTHTFDSHFSSSDAPPPQQGISRTDTDTLLASQPDRAEQVEYMQNYESQAAGNQSEHDRNRAQLEKEFPGVDGSLIAALYGDTGSLPDTREMLQELAREGQ